MELRTTIVINALATFFIGLGVGMLMTGGPEREILIRSLPRIILGAIVFIFTTYSITNKLKSIQMKGGKVKWKTQI